MNPLQKLLLSGIAFLGACNYSSGAKIEERVSQGAQEFVQDLNQELSEDFKKKSKDPFSRYYQLMEKGIRERLTPEESQELNDTYLESLKNAVGDSVKNRLEGLIKGTKLEEVKEGYEKYRRYELEFGRGPKKKGIKFRLDPEIDLKGRIGAKLNADFGYLLKGLKFYISSDPDGGSGAGVGYEIRF